MENDKIKKEIFNPEGENHKKLEQLFPGIIKDGALDISALLDELGEYEVVEKEKYELTWAGKSKAKQIANTDITGRTLHYIPEDSKDPDTTENLYIEGDNLEVLKLLRSSYYGQIKMIYIDPPYNTDNDFIYVDKFSMSKNESDLAEGDLSEDGSRLILNQRSSNRFHANWLNMMYSRIKVAKDLLHDDGIFFISIGDQELFNLKEICDEIFSESNYYAIISWTATTKAMNAGDAKFKIQKSDEYILVYGKKSMPDHSPFNLSNKGNKEYPFEKNGRRYRLEEIQQRKNTGIKRSEKMVFPILGLLPKEGFRWTIGSDTAKNLEKNEDVTLEKDKAIRKIYEDEEDSEMFYPLWANFSDLYGTSETGKALLHEILGSELSFETVKPIELINKLLFHFTDSDDTVLDFFSGSATTAHAIMQLNAEDAGKRKYILVQLQEKISEEKNKETYAFLQRIKKPQNICEIGKERIRKAGEKIKVELLKDKNNNHLLEDDMVDPEKLDFGFKVFRVGETNIRWNKENFDQQRTLEESAYSDKDHLDFMAGFKDIDIVYEIMLRHRDIPLSSKVDLLKNIGPRTYIFADTVVVCLEEKITNEIVDKIAAIDPKPQKIIFRDSAFDDDISLKLNTLTRFDIQLKKNNQTKDQTYRVEFI